MQQLFPEGYVFSWALYGLAAAETARQLPLTDPRRPALLTRTQSAIRHLDSPTARAPFSAGLDPPYGAFYAAWRLYLRASYVRAAGANHVGPALLAGFENDCAALAATFERSPTPFPPSYAGAAWPADASVGIAALGLHDHVCPPRYAPLIARWVAAVHQRLDPARQVLPHAADPTTGAPRGGTRGSSLALMSRVLADAAPALARAQYEVLRREFVDYRWSVPGVREYPRGTNGSADIDSGPLVLGFSGPATVVGAAAARAHGDTVLADALLGTVEIGGLPIEWRGRRYAGGTVLVGDAFIAWANATAVVPSPAVPWALVVPVSWAWPGHAVSLALVVLLLCPLWWKRARRAAVNEK